MNILQSQNALQIQHAIINYSREPFTEITPTINIEESAIFYFNPIPQYGRLEMKVVIDTFDMASRELVRFDAFASIAYTGNVDDSYGYIAIFAERIYDELTETIREKINQSEDIYLPQWSHLSLRKVKELILEAEAVTD